MTKKKKTRTRVAKGVLLISFIILLTRLIYSSINAWDYYKNNNQSDSSIIKTHITSLTR